ncbi:MAG: DUF4389 domain-containing protein [Burkholderiales bacterium]|nr:DUF4389 domain-containing protein [Burkholderiales bacterium]
MSDAKNPWVRALFMLLLGMLYSLAGTVLLIVAVAQFIFLIAGGTPNSRLASFGHSLGEYIRQIVEFQTFNTEEKPFPFSDWPQ